MYEGCEGYGEIVSFLLDFLMILLLFLLYLYLNYAPYLLMPTVVGYKQQQLYVVHYS